MAVPYLYQWHVGAPRVDAAVVEQGEQGASAGGLDF
jgi:hypothetical protein